MARDLNRLDSKSIILYESVYSHIREQAKLESISLGLNYLEYISEIRILNRTLRIQTRIRDQNSSDKWFVSNTSEPLSNWDSSHIAVSRAQIGHILDHVIREK